MTEKKIYDYTTNDDLSTLEYATISYSYDTTWKDKLVSYNGQEITCDEIGNPISYLGNTMTWTGRNLRKVVTDDATIKYVYNASGVRTKNQNTYSGSINKASANSTNVLRRDIIANKINYKEAVRVATSAMIMVPISIGASNLVVLRLLD